MITLVEILESIDEIGFSGTKLDGPPKATETIVIQLVVSELPDELRQVFERAGTENRLILIDIHGPA